MTTHLRIARQRDRARRLLVAGAVSLSVSLLAWLAGAGLALHAGLVAVAFVTALLLPVRGATRWALGWIVERSGFSYQTALETRDLDDPYGLHRAVSERAAQRVRHLDAPRPTAWWLPLLAVALGLLLLPAAELSGFGSGGTETGPSPVGTPPQAAEPLPPEPEAVAPLEEPDPTLRADEPAGDGAEEDGGGDDRAGEGAGAAQDEQQVLDRFLENLRERDPTEQEQQERQGAAPENLQPRPQQGDPQAGDEQRGRPDGDAETQAGTEQEGQQGENDGDATQGGQTGTEEDAAGEGEQGGGEPGPGEQADGDEPAEGPQGDEPPTGDNAPTQGDDDAGLGAGGLPGIEQEGEGLEGGAEAEPEFLEGQLGAGPENPGGLIRLPGRDEVDLPQGFEPQTYIRAAEEAVTDGNIPVDYQEVIRNYFR